MPPKIPYALVFPHLVKQIPSDCRNEALTAPVYSVLCVFKYCLHLALDLAYLISSLYLRFREMIISLGSQKVVQPA